MIVRKHFRFTGRVQGVGFRYRAKYAANGMGITGWQKMNMTVLLRWRHKGQRKQSTECW